MTTKRLIALLLCLLVFVGIVAACVAYPPTPTATSDTRGVAGPVEFRQVRVLNDLTVDGDATVSGGLSVTGDVDLNSGN